MFTKIVNRFSCSTKEIISTSKSDWNPEVSCRCRKVIFTISSRHGSLSIWAPFGVRVETQLSSGGPRENWSLAITSSPTTVFWSFTDQVPCWKLLTIFWATRPSYSWNWNPSKWHSKTPTKGNGIRSCLITPWNCGKWTCHRLVVDGEGSIPNHHARL